MREIRIRRRVWDLKDSQMRKYKGEEKPHPSPQGCGTREEKRPPRKAEGTQAGLTDQLTFCYGDYEFQGGVGGAEGGDFDVGEAGAESGGANMVFGDGLLSLGIDDPEGSGILEGAGGGFDGGEFGERIGSEKDPGRGSGFSAGDDRALLFEVGEETGGERA